MLKTVTRPQMVLFFGLLAVATAAIFIRLAQEEKVPSLVIAAGRMLTAILVLTPYVWQHYRAELAQLTRPDLLLCLLSGGVLGIHFAAWISSLEYTSVAASVVLVTTNPLFVALLSLPLLGEKVKTQVVAGIGLAFVGGIIVALSGDAGDPPTRSAPLLGNALALIGAVAAAIYFIIGRRLRANLALIPYIWLVYGAAALVLTLAALSAGQSFGGYTPLAYGWIIAMGLIPQLIGHSAFNYALGHLPAAYVSLVVLGEPVGSTLLAILILKEWPSPLAVLGSAIILAGIALATYQRQK
jgi:drug/metabolite transporter (DMT)-like permease